MKIKQCCKSSLPWGRVGGQVVSMLAFYSDDQSSNPPEAYSIFLWNENKQKGGHGWPIF